MPRLRTTSDAEILAATARTIARKGPAKVTLTAIAKEVGLAPATLMQRFGSKRRAVHATYNGSLLAWALTGETVPRCPANRYRPCAAAVPHLKEIP